MEIFKDIEPEDLLKFGLIPEFVGRLPVLATLEDLDQDALVTILTEPKNALIKQYQRLFELEDTKLNFTDDALNAIAKRAIDIGCTAIMVSNHGGRQLDGSRSPFDQLSEIVDAVGDKLDVICEGGIHRGTHMLKALSLGAKACSGGRLYLYALAAAGQAGVERALEKYKSELVRDMKLMGCTKISDLNRSNLRFRT